MPASITFPSNAPNYNSLPLVPKVVGWRNAPPEGDRAIPLNMAWGATGDDRGTGAVVVNLANLQTGPFSQIEALYVDNIQSGADVTFIFQDTQFEFTVPGGAAGLFPVISTALQFVAYSPMAQAGDKTFIQALNSMPPPWAIEKSVFMSVVAVSGIAFAAATTVVIPHTVALGTLTNLEIAAIASNSSGSTGQATIVMQDGASNVVAVAQVEVLNNGIFVGPLLSLSGLNVRFKTGLDAVVTISGGALSGGFNVNAYYRTP